MKKNRLFLLLLSGVFFVTGCKKDDGALPKEILAVMDDVPAITTKVNVTGSPAINFANLASFSGKFDVAMYWPEATPPAKVDIVVRKNGANTNVKVFQAGVTNLPATFTVTAPQIAALFGVPIALGDTYDFAVDIYLANGKKYEGFPLGGIGTSSGPVNQPGYSEFARFAAVCSYDPSIFQGNFTVISDEFEDFAVGSTVVITQVSANQFSFIQPAVTNAVPMVFTVNVANNGVSLQPKLKIGDAFTWPPFYTGPQVTVAANPALSFVEPCAKRITLQMDYSVDLGSFGRTWLLVLQKP